MSALAGILASSNVRSADGNNAGLLLELDAILAVTLGGTSLLGGRFSLAGSVLGALIIQTLTYDLFDRRAAGGDARRQGGRRDRRDADQSDAARALVVRHASRLLSSARSRATSGATPR